MLDWLLKRKLSPMAEALATEYPLVAAGQGGILSGTHVASHLGWRPIEALAVGDMVLTFDHGMQPIVDIHRETILLSSGGPNPLTCPVHIPQDALNNRAPLWVMPNQGILIESDLACDGQGDPFVVVPACALEGYRGIGRVEPDTRVEIMVPRFAQDEVIYLEAGLLSFSVSPRDILSFDTSAYAELYRVLDPDAARELVIDMITEESVWANTLPMGPGGHGAAEYAAMV
ncbi:MULTISPECIES: Hint domain-containing protein [unclassified Phaeobacter]|uniref:Hint domain-containing protein n=1 Tax=unclassified Phaeobacter TaxID=2621772 RepID=UPI003A8BED62